MRLQMIFSLQKKEGPKPSFFRVVSAEADRLFTQRPLLRLIVHRVSAPVRQIDHDGSHVNLCPLCFGDEGGGCTGATFERYHIRCFQHYGRAAISLARSGERAGA